jgi:hypothetical protein
MEAGINVAINQCCVVAGKIRGKAEVIYAKQRALDDRTSAA